MTPLFSVVENLTFKSSYHILEGDSWKEKVFEGFSPVVLSCLTLFSSLLTHSYWSKYTSTLFFPNFFLYKYSWLWGNMKEWMLGLRVQNISRHENLITRTSKANTASAKTEIKLFPATLSCEIFSILFNIWTLGLFHRLLKSKVEVS